MDDGAAAGGTGMCRVRRPVRPDEGGEGIREADGLPGEKTFGDFGSLQSHSPRPEGRAKLCRGQSPRVPWGEATSRGSLLVLGRNRRRGKGICCGVMRCAYCTLRQFHCVTKLRHHINAANV